MEKLSDTPCHTCGSRYTYAVYATLLCRRSFPIHDQKHLFLKGAGLKPLDPIKLTLVTEIGSESQRWAYSCNQVVVGSTEPEDLPEAFAKAYWTCLGEYQKIVVSFTLNQPSAGAICDQKMWNNLFK